MSGYIDLGLDGFQRDTQALEEKFRKMDKEVQDRIAKEVVAEAGQIFLEEQKRLLASAPNPKMRKFADSLKIWEHESKSGWRVEVGYPAEMFSVVRKKRKSKVKKGVSMSYEHEKYVEEKDNIEVYIYEFGRPGAKGLKKGGTDTIGRKIGKTEPYSVIRAAMFLKREEVVKEIERRFYEEIEKIWNE